MPDHRAHEVIPSARRLINSLRDMGYDFAQAVADIVDNSIEAGATLVAIDVEFDGDDSWVRIADNGKGMTAVELREAMRYGAERDYTDDDLGKFGLGLKTASMSQCQRLSVASRWNRERADVSAYCWDLEHIDRTNRWEILPLERTGLGPAIREPLKDTTGTVVLWQRLDRILGYRHPYGEAARKRLSQMCRDLEAHLGMVFERFLTGKARRKSLKILINGNEVAAWDPFCLSETRTQALDPIHIGIEHEGTSGEVALQPYILPHQDDFSSPAAFRRASGPSGWNQQQGFYIYRAGRMIQSGGWSHLRAPDEHVKLARVAISFHPKLDEAFKINVAKMRVQLPSQIREEIRSAVAPVVRLARERYDRRPPRAGTATGLVARPTASTGASVIREASQVRPSAAGVGPRPESGDELLTLDQWLARMLDVANRKEAAVVRSVAARLQNNLR